MTTVLDGIEITYGGHRADEGKACLMECVAILGGEPWGDHPTCASPLLAQLGRSLNDRLLTSPERIAKYGPELLALAPLLVGTRDDASETLRANMIGDWYIREHLPRILTHAGLEKNAEALASLPPVTESNFQAAIDTVADVGRAARAARDAWAARDARAATFDLTAQARAKAAGVELSADTITDIMAPVVEELERDSLALFRRLILAGPHGAASPVVHEEASK